MPTTIEFEFHGVKELSKKLQRAPDSVLRIALNEGLREIGRLIVPGKGTGPLADETPKGKTQRLSRSSYYRIGGDPKAQRLEVLQPAMTEDGVFYGVFVREKTEPHIIRPRKAKALRFEIEGDIVFAQKVNHPGSPANPYHERVLSRLRGPIQEVVNKIGRKVTAYLSGGGK